MGNLGVRLQCPTSVFIAGVELAMLEKLKIFAKCESGATAQIFCVSAPDTIEIQRPPARAASFVSVRVWIYARLNRPRTFQL